MSQKTELQSNNADLQTILSKVNGLPSGSALGDATAADVAAGKTFSSASGIKVTGAFTKNFYSTAYSAGQSMQFSFGGSGTTCFYINLPIADIGFDPRIVCVTAYSQKYQAYSLTYIDLTLLGKDTTSGGWGISSLNRYHLYLNDPNRPQMAVIKDGYMRIPITTSDPGAYSLIEVFAVP